MLIKAADFIRRGAFVFLPEGGGGGFLLYVSLKRILQL